MKYFKVQEQKKNIKRNLLTSTNEKFISTSDLTNPPHPSMSWVFMWPDKLNKVAKNASKLGEMIILDLQSSTRGSNTPWSFRV